MLLNDGGCLYIGDIAFDTRTSLQKCKEEVGDEWDDDEIYFCVGDFKEVYKQMQANPYVEICATIETDFIRYFGKAVFVESADLEAKAFEVLPMLKQLYNEKTGFKMKIFKLEEAVAEFRSMMKVEERIEF